MKPQSLRARLLLFIVVVMLTPILPGSYLYYQYTTTLNDADIVRQQSALKFSLTQDVIDSFHRQIITWGSFLLQGHKPELYNSHLRKFYREERQTYTRAESLANLLNQDPEYSVDISHILDKMEGLRKHHRNALEIYNLSDDPYFDTDQFLSPFTVNINYDLQQLVHQIKALEERKISAMNDAIAHQKILFLAIMLVILLLSISIFIWFFDINVGRPITAAISTAERIADGNIKSRIEEESSREFSVFSKAFNHMIDNLELAHQEAVGANQAKSEFLSSMSHELRTPLNAILGFGQLLEMKYNEISDIEGQEHTKHIMQAGHHLLELINEVLDLSRIEAGHLDISAEPIPLHQNIAECITQIDAGLASQCNVTLINQVDDQDIEILADPMRFKQILINLLSNAVKYNKKGGTVTIKTEHLDNKRLRIAVIDTGKGIVAADMDKLFEPFERLSAKNGNIEGTGVGLTVTKQLVEAMDGVITVESRVGQGSTFMVELPLNNDIKRDVVSDKPPLPLPLPKTGTIENKKHKVLYIEDNPVNATLVLDAMNRRGGFEVLTSSTAELGLTLAEEVIPDIILMDINLPGIDGIAALNVLRSMKITRHIPVIAVTAHATDNDIQAGRGAGFDDYLTKPLDLDQLFVAIERQITKPNAA